jgi:hypothetical protein
MTIIGRDWRIAEAGNLAACFSYPQAMIHLKETDFLSEEWGVPKSSIRKGLHRGDDLTAPSSSINAGA